MWRRPIWLGVLLAVSAAAAAGASTFLALSEKDLAASAAAVVQGRVIEARATWNAERTAILTDALVAVDEVLLGRAPRVVRVRTFGGTVDGYTIEAHGFPRFAPGQEMVLFLYREPADQSVRVVGYQQGQYRVETRGGERVAVPAVGERVRLLAPDGVEMAPARALPLAELKSRVRELGRQLGRLEN